MKILVFESDYTGEINGRLGVAEWLEGKVTHVPLSVATAVVEGVGNAEEFNDHDILIAGTGEDTTELGLKFANKVGRPLTVFLASILPDELDPSIQQYDLIVAPPHSPVIGRAGLDDVGGSPSIQARHPHLRYDSWPAKTGSPPRWKHPILRGIHGGLRPTPGRSTLASGESVEWKVHHYQQQKNP